MARYVTKVRTPRSPEDAFEFMADLRNFEQWDPGVHKVTQFKGIGPGVDSEFDVTVASVGRDIKMRYRTTEFVSPTMVLVVAKTAMLTSTDRITIDADGSGSIVTYDAELCLRGVWKVFAPAMALSFRKIGDRAAAGLRTALDGTDVPL
jgi:carbon monoxide dehydrogenase subunit G